jgi:hypothetical protein
MPMGRSLVGPEGLAQCSDGGTPNGSPCWEELTQLGKKRPAAHAMASSCAFAMHLDLCEVAALLCDRAGRAGTETYNLS